MAGPIAQYDAGNVGLNPTEIGVDATAQAARRVGSLYHQEGENLGSAVATAGQVAEKYMAHREISAGSAAYAGLQASLTDQWNEQVKNADPNDPTVAKKFQAGLDAQFDKYLDSFHTEEGQRWAESHIDNLRQHLFTKTSADMSTLAGIAVKTNYEKTVNTLSSTAASDPSSLSFQLKTAESTISGMADSSPNLDAATSATVKTELLQKAKEQIIKSAVSGMIQKNPNVDLDAIQKQYGEYINGAEIKQFQKAAQVQAKANALVDKQSQVAQRQLDELNVHKDATKVLTDNVAFDPTTGRPIIDPKFFSQTLDIAKKNSNAPNAASTVQTMFNWGESQQNKGAKPADDPTVQSDLMTRMFSADNPTTTLDLMKARADGKISDHTFQAYHGLVTELEQSPLKGPVWHDTIEAVKSELVLSNVGLPGKDIAGEGNYAKWAQTFIPQYLAKSRAGTLPPNALDPKDPTSLISQSMAPFKRTVAQRAQDYLSVLSGTPAASALPKIETRAQFDGLPSGASYVGSDGKTYRKP